MDEKIEMLEKLCKVITEELEEYSKKIEKSDGMSAGDLEAVDKLSHALKSIKTSVAMMDAGGSYNSYARDGGSNRGSNRGGANRGGSNRSYDSGSYDGSYARRRDSMGRYAREGYSREDDFRMMLEDAMEHAPNAQTREKIRRMMADM